MLSGIVLLFWHQEFKYNLPTPVPVNYKTVLPGNYIDSSVTGWLKKDKPLFIHFFNPDCPCSRFNITHFKSLVKKYGDRLNFGVVLVQTDNAYPIDYIKNKYGLNIPVSVDQSIAAACAVYATPQAVIIDTDNKLYYRGNYNRTRYCTDVKSNYAQMAIDSLLKQQKVPQLGVAAYKSYGCQLPNCTK
jgi:hypothetical protein